MRKMTTPQTDPSLSFEAVDSSFECKVGQKIGMAVCRNYEFDFTNDDTCTNNHWKKEDLPKEDILRIFGTDNRECFANAANATDKGYTHAPR